MTEGILAVLYVSIMGLTRFYKTTVFFTFIVIIINIIFIIMIVNIIIIIANRVSLLVDADHSLQCIGGLAQRMVLPPHITRQHCRGKAHEQTVHMPGWCLYRHIYNSKRRTFQTSSNLAYLY